MSVSYRDVEECEEVSRRQGERETSEASKGGWKLKVGQNDRSKGEEEKKKKKREREIAARRREGDCIRRLVGR